MTAVLLAALLPGRADDQIVLKNGSTVSGQIAGVSGDQVTVATRTPSGGLARLPYYLRDIKSVTMATPAPVAQVKGSEPKAVIAALEPLVKQYAGLPADWVPEAMAQVADAYGTINQPDAATALYAQIAQLYPGSSYVTLAVAGQAKQLLQQGKPADAITALQPTIDAANKNLAPSPSDGRVYANAFLVYGQALEAQKKFSQALEAYLTVKTTLYQNQALVDQADQLVQNLRGKNPGVGVD